MKIRRIVLGSLVIFLPVLVSTAYHFVSLEIARREKITTMILRSFLRNSVMAQGGGICPVSSPGIPSYITPELAGQLMPDVPNAASLCANVFRLRPHSMKDHSEYSNVRLLIGSGAEANSFYTVGFLIVVEIDGRISIYDDCGGVYSIADCENRLRGMVGDRRYIQEVVRRHIEYFGQLTGK